MPTPNFNYIKQLSQGDEAFEASLLNVIKHELPDETRAFEEYFSKGQYVKAAEEVHKIKHKVSLLGMEKSYLIAEEFEENLRHTRTHLYQEFKGILKKIVTFLDRN